METYNLATFTSITGLYPVPDDENEYYGEDEYIPYPEDIVREWFETEANVGEDDLEHWLHYTYMLSDTEDLFAYAKKHGCKWERNFSLYGHLCTLTELKEKYSEDTGIHPDENSLAAKAFWNWVNNLTECRMLTDDKITVTYTPEKKNKVSKNSIPLLTEAVIELVDAIDEDHPSFRFSFDDSREFNYTISQWAEEFLDWWDAEKEAGKNHDYTDSIEDFVAQKVKAETTNTYRVWYTMSGFVEVEASSEEEAKELARSTAITWDNKSIDFADITKED